MSSKILLNNDTAIDLPTLLDTRLLVQANSGGGKSWLLRRMLEQSHGTVQQMVIDLEGEFATLREHYDYVLAGREGDTPADPRSAGLLARRLLDLNVSAIIDLYELHSQDRKRFVRLFLESMINAPKALWHPCLVVIDEAHKFCPEKEPSEASSAVIDLATLGRKRGYCAILATQRLSKLHKDAAAECNNKLIGRTNLDVDMKRASEELGFTTKEQALTLRTLSAGEFFAYGPALSAEVSKVTIGPVTTTHPTAGSRIVATTALPPPENIRKLLGALKDLPQEAAEEAQTVEQLQAQVTHLTRQLTLATQQEPHTGAAAREHHDDTSQKEELARLKKRNELLEIYVAVLRIRFTEILETISELKTSTLPPSPEEAETSTLPPEPPTASLLVPQPAPTVAGTHNHAQAHLTTRQERAGLPQGAQRMLGVLISRHPLQFTKAQLATLAQLSARSGSYSRYLALLKQEGLITVTNQLISLTEKGLKHRPVISSETHTGGNLIEMWRSSLPSGAQRIFDTLVAEYPKAFRREDLGTMTGLSPRSGSFSRYLSMLRNNGLIDTQGTLIKAAPVLFS